METINVRIAQLVKESGKTKTEWAGLLNVTPQFVSALCNGKKKPSERTLSDICRISGVRMEWLLDGLEPVYESEVDPLRELLHGQSISKRERALVKSFLELPQSSREVVVDFVEQCARELNAQLPEPEAEELDLASEVVALKRQNQELLVRLEAIEKEDALLGRMPEPMSGGTLQGFRSSGSFSGTGNKKSSGV